MDATPPISSAEADQTALLRFFGWMAATNRPEVGDSITFMIRDDIDDIAQEYAQWLQNTQHCKFSTIANYINGLVSITSYCLQRMALSSCCFRLSRVLLGSLWTSSITLLKRAVVGPWRGTAA